MRRYFRSIENWRWAGLVLLAGYALGMFGWQLNHWPLLSSYLTNNQLTAAQRVDLAIWLVTGIAVVGAVWLVAGAFLTHYGPQPAFLKQADISEFWLTASARLCVALLSLPFLPLLAVPNIEAQEPLLLFFMVTVVSALVVGAVKAGLVVRSQWLEQARPMAYRPLPATNHRLRATAYRSPIAGLAFGWVLGGAVAYALFMSLLTVGRHNAFGTNAFDLGIHAQALFTIAQRGYPAVTLYGPQVINQFGDHFAPIFYLLVPIYLPWSDARVLLVLQSVTLASGVIPVYLLARHKLVNLTLALVVAAGYLLFPALHGVNNFDFHEIALVIPLLLWSFFFLEVDRFRLFGIFLALALLTKEEVALTGIAIGFYILFVQRKIRRGALVMASCALYFALVVGVIMPLLGGGADTGRFAEMQAAGFEGFTGVAVTLFTNPFFAFDYAFFNTDKLFFLAQLLLPVLGVPLLAGAGPWIVALPGFATLLLSSYRAQYLLETHYSAIVIPSIFFLSVLGLANLEQRRQQAIAPLAAGLLAASLLMNWQFGWVGGKLFHGIPRPDPHDRAIASLINVIPPAASVSTLSKLVPHLANREQIYLYPTVAEAEYILFDPSLQADFFPLISRDPRGEAIERLLPFILSGEYGLLRAEDGVLLLHRGHDTAGNSQALAALGSVTYDAVAMFGSPSMQRIEDAKANSGQARLSQGMPSLPDDILPVVSGPYATVIPGRYRVDFRLKLVEPPDSDGLVAIIDVFSHAVGGQIVQRRISVAEFMARDATTTDSTSGTKPYHTFSLEFQIDRLLKDVEFRVLHTGLGTLAVDTIRVEYLGAAGE